MWHFFALCILHLHCFASALLCFAFALRTCAFPQGVAHVKIKKTLATPQISCARIAPPRGCQGCAVAISWNHRLRCVLGMGTWCVSSNVGVSVDHSVIAPAGERNALMPHSVWLGAYIVRRPVARKPFAFEEA
jgi:hypothetical protein